MVVDVTPAPNNPAPLWTEPRSDRNSSVVSLGSVVLVESVVSVLLAESVPPA